MIECAFDTNLVAIMATIYSVKSAGKSADSAYRELVNQGFSYGQDVFKRVCKLLKKVENDEVKVFISPLVAVELHHPNIPKEVVNKIDAFLFEQRVSVIDTDGIDYDKLVEKYMQPQGEDGHRCFKEKSLNDAYIMAHATYAGIPLVTCNFSDFTKGQKPERIRKTNEEFYKKYNLKEMGVSQKFTQVKPYTPYHFVEEYLPRAEREEAQGRFVREL